MLIDYSFCEAAPDKDPMNDILTEYYQLMISRILSMGGTVPQTEGDTDRKTALDEFWEDINYFLPPSGRLVLAKAEDGHLVGCASLKSLSATKGELKRLVVRPETRGLGAGRKLIQLILDEARGMGIKTVYFDTLNNAVEMRSLCVKMGLREIQPYEESATLKLIPELAPYICFYAIDL